MLFPISFCTSPNFQYTNQLCPNALFVLLPNKKRNAQAVVRMARCLFTPRLGPPFASENHKLINTARESPILNYWR